MIRRNHPWTFVLILLSSAGAYSGDSVGNGGNGIRKGEKVYSLDLFEAGVQEEAFFNLKIKVRPRFLKRVKDCFPSSSDRPSFPTDKIVQKLSEVFERDSVFAASVLSAMEMYSWRFVDSSLIDSNDHETVLNIDPKDLVQLAIRRDRSIWIDRPLWSLLSEDNRVALIFHEAIYALTKPAEDTDEAVAQASVQARELTGYLFTPELESKGSDGFYSLAYHLPTYMGEAVLPPGSQYKNLSRYVSAGHLLTDPSSLSSEERAVSFRPGIILDGGFYSISDSDDGRYYAKYAALLCLTYAKNKTQSVHLEIQSSDYELRFSDSKISNSIDWSRIDRLLPWMIPETKLDIDVQDPNTCADNMQKAFQTLSKEALSLYDL